MKVVASITFTKILDTEDTDWEPNFIASLNEMPTGGKVELFKDAINADPSIVINDGEMSHPTVFVITE